MEWFVGSVVMLFLIWQYNDALLKIRDLEYEVRDLKNKLEVVKK
jgi:hypothetical protein